MNLIDNELDKEKEKNNKIIKIIIVFIAILFILGIVLFAYMSYLKSKQFSFKLNSVTMQNYPSDLFYDDDGEKYVSVKDLVNLMKKNKMEIDYNNGGYKDYTEDNTKCYIETVDEVAGFEANSSKMYKVIKTDEIFEYFSLDKPVKSINGKLYTSLEGIRIGFNVALSFDKDSNTLRITTLDEIVKKYETQLNKAGISSKSMSFANKKALRYGMMIVKNSEGLYGVNNISSGESILGIKFTDLKFVESTKDFIVTTPEKKQGILSVDNGKTIEPQYTEIQQLDAELNLYLVKNEKGKYGVYNREKQEAIIYPEYDSIGVDKQAFEMENPYILYDYCIPCKKIEDGIEKWQLINIDGNKITQVYYDALGYVKGTKKDTKGNNVLIIPEIEGIVVYKDDVYGIINSTGKQLVKTELEQVYSETSGGKNIYYMVYNGQTINILDLLEKANSSNSEEKKNNNTSQGNTGTDEKTNNSTGNTTNNSTTGNTTNNTVNSTTGNTTNNTINSTTGNTVNNTTNNAIQNGTSNNNSSNTSTIPSTKNAVN